MRNPTSFCGYGLTLALSFLFLLYSCKKQDQIISSYSLLHVNSTYPGKNQLHAAYDSNVIVVLDQLADTSKFAISLTVLQGDTTLRGTIRITDSVVTFVPETELLPTHSYTATLTLTQKATGQSFYRYQWNFTTKDPDEYRMTKRSDRVTDFVRDGTRSMQIGNYLYSFGGWNVPETSYNDVYRSSGDLNQWEKRPNAPWHGRHVYGIGKIADTTFIIGGDNLQSQFDVWCTKNGEDWTLLKQDLLNNRIYYGCTVHNGFIYIVGGSGFNDVWRSRNGINWEQVADAVEFLKSESFTGSLTSFNGKLWMVCGGTDGYGNGSIRKEVWSSTDGRIWQREIDFGGTKRYYNDVCVWDNKLWVVGGYNFEEGNIRSIWYMKPNGTWTEYQTPADYVGRHATGVAVYNNQLVITCGNYNNDCWAIEKVK